MIIRIIVDLLQLYRVLLFVRIILTWFPIDPWSKAARPYNLLARVTDPVLWPLRRLIPPLRVGGAAIDLSPIIIFVAISVIIGVLQSH